MLSTTTVRMRGRFTARRQRLHFAELLERLRVLCAAALHVSPDRIVRLEVDVLQPLAGRRRTALVVVRVTVE